ncbi:MAG: hypothetical protein RLZZ127_2240, partial [Planctomycetota bacterium]
MAGWSHEHGLLLQEIVQRRDEGCRVPAWIIDGVEALRGEANQWNEERAAPLWQALERLEPDPVLAAVEPDDLAAIRALRPEGPRDLRWSPDEAELLDRLHGAWTGRAAGCALGKPVESGLLGMAVEDGRSVGRHRIRRYLEARGEWPLTDYFSAESRTPGL